MRSLPQEPALIMPVISEADIQHVRSIAALPTILDVICQTTGMGFAAVARVTADRWIACGVRDEMSFGLEPGGELKVDTTICHEIRDSLEPVVIDDVSADQRYCLHATPKMYGFRSYISMPIILPDGRFFGTLCAISLEPAELNTPRVVGMFKLFAELIGFQLQAAQQATASVADLQQARAQLAVSAVDLAAERDAAALREEFLAILGHDLRNPITAIQSGLRLVERTPLTERAVSVVRALHQSAARMAELVANMLDFTRGRLGGGMRLARTPDAPLATSLSRIVEELRIGWPDRVIETRFALGQPVDCDCARIDQLLSNLLSNALTHGAPAQPIYVQALSAHGAFELSVSNSGPPISQEAIPQLFNPFVRASERAPQQGLGLGLHIAAEIARAHGGEISVASDATATVFTLRMPASQSLVD